MRMLISLEFADAGVMTGTHKVLVVEGCSDSTAPGDIGMSLEEAKALLMAIQWEFVAAQAAEIVEIGTNIHELLHAGIAGDLARHDCSSAT